MPNTALDVFMSPGRGVIDLILLIFQFSPADAHAMLLTIAAGLLSWFIWLLLVKLAWGITMRLLGLA